MFLNLDKKKADNILFIDDARAKITYGEMRDFVKSFGGKVGKRTLVAILCRNTVGGGAGFIACMSNRIVPMMIG